uniref:Thioesterase domain-containing protein n=1 Tax=Globodera rostochiensis TaxID=31243 RepID=A0A914HHQ1_GLORO
MSSLNYLNLARSLFRNFGAMKNFERCADKCRVVHADEGRLQVELDLQEEHANLHGTMHGGLTATLV